MTRRITYFNQLANSLFANEDEQNRMIEDSALAQAILGITTQITGFNCIPNSPADLTVIVEGGTIFKMLETDATAFGSGGSQLPVDTNQILKYGVSTNNTTLNITPPGTIGYSRNDLVQIDLVEADADPETVAFWNGVTGNTPNNPITQTLNVLRETNPVITVKQGTAAPTGTQTTPSPDSGKAGVWVITTADGQTTITSGDIVQYSGAPFVNILSQTSADARYAQLDAANTFTKTQTAPLFSGSATGLTFASATFASGVANGDVVYYDTGTNKYNKAIAGLTAARNALGFADVTNARVLTAGIVSGFTGLTPGVVYYLSSTTAGAISSTSTPGRTILVGLAKSATELFVSFNYLTLPPPECASVSLTGTQSVVNNNVPVPVLFDTIDYDNGLIWDNANNWYNISEDGFYTFFATMFFNAGAPGAVGGFRTEIWNNGVAVVRLNEVFTSANNVTIPGASRLQFSAGDHVQLYVSNNSSATTNLGTGITCSFQIKYEGPLG